MEIYVFDKNFGSKNMIDNFTSLIWTERYNECGDFQLDLPPTNAYFSAVALGDFLYIADSNKVMVTEKIEFTNSGIKITGRSLESILERRIVNKALTPLATTTVAQIVGYVTYYISKNASSVYRQVANLYVDSTVPAGFTDTTIDTDAPSIGNNLYDLVKSLAKESSLGFRIRKENGNYKLWFETYYEGIARKNSRMPVFGQTYDNIEDFTQTEDNLSERNIAIGFLPKTTSEGQSMTAYPSETAAVGIDRRELWVDASSLRSDSTWDSASSTTRQKRVSKFSLAALAQMNRTVEMDFEVLSGTYVYGVDYSLGDRVTVLGIRGEEKTYRVSEIVRSYTNTGAALYPNLVEL